MLLVCKGLLLLSSDELGVARGTVFSRDTAGGAGFKNDFDKEKLGGGYRRMTPLCRGMFRLHSRLR